MGEILLTDVGPFTVQSWICPAGINSTVSQAVLSMAMETCSPQLLSVLIWKMELQIVLITVKISMKLKNM